MMRTHTLRLALVLSLILVLTSVVFPALAQTPTIIQIDPTGDVLPFGVLTSLADAMPGGTVMYAAMRTDETAFEWWDELAVDITAGLPGAMPGTAEESLDMVSQFVFETPFEDIRAWLGDGIAMGGVPRSDVTFPLYHAIVAIHLRDAEAAIAFFEASIFPSMDVSREELGDAVLYSDSVGGGVLFRGDLALISSDVSLLSIEEGAPRLAAAPAFQEAVAALSAPDYTVLMYLDLPRLLARERSRAYQFPYYHYYEYAPPPPSGDAALYAALLQTFGPVAVGLTRAENGDLALDVAVTKGNLKGVEPLGLSFSAPRVANPADLMLAPHSAFAVVQGGDLSGFFVELYRTFGPAFRDAMMQPNLRDPYYGYGYGSPLLYGLLDRMDVMQIADLILGNVLGVSVADLQNWSSRDYVLFAQINPDWSPGSPWNEWQIEMAGVFRVVSREQSFEAFENLARSLTLLADSSGNWQNVSVDVTRGEAHRELAVTFHRGDDTGGFTVTLIVTDGVAIFGLEGPAQAALLHVQEPSPAPWVAEAFAALPPGAAVSGFIQPSQFVSVITAMTNEQTADIVRPLFAKLDALAFNVRVTPRGHTVFRFTASLNDAADTETLLGRPTMVPPDLNATRTAMAEANATFQAEWGATLTAAPVFITMMPFAPETTAEVGFMTPTYTPWDFGGLPTPVTPLPTLFVLPSLTPMPIPPEATAEADTASVVPALFYDIPSFRGTDGAFTLGSPDAPVTLVVFADWACPHCQAYKPVVDEVIESMVRAGSLKLEHRTLVTAGGDSTRYIAALAECAEEQQLGVFWALSDVLYTIGGTRDYNVAAVARSRIAGNFGLNEEALQSCTATAEQLDIDRDYARQTGANATPFVLLRGPGGVTVVVSDRTREGIMTEVIKLMGGALLPTPTPTYTIHNDMERRPTPTLTPTPVR